ncbi:restriction endonuclease [Bradyrhizobium sp. JYMT SZCCT0180]|uniref:McrC family protein n=1 Tax=Bradyrhizobium sp. JYMT SZCCT0180 TaxID=2807666 RepID=UPI001BAC8493|nr:restriction endonuclease [Bradyrhizobium sp. JYMT SZCCT0180]MBR1214626.1 restriction endonuclease [Bradyrhizobium sp. JYMT SZCCT0180]
MIHRTVREWDYIAVEPPIGGPAGLSRSVADRLLKAARNTALGGEDGEKILVNGVSRLRAQQVVGILATEDATLEILPKIDGSTSDNAAARRSLVHMLAVVLDLEIAPGANADLSWQKDDLLEILVRLFCDKLFAVLHRGMPRRYVGNQDDLSTLRGRLDVVRQFTVLGATPQKLACQFENLSADIALNQIMKAAVARLTTTSRSEQNRRRLTELAFAFDEVSAVAVKELPWNKVVIDRTNSGWLELFRFARLLLGDRFQTTTRGNARGFSLLFEMNTLFEEFIGRMFRRALSGTAFQVVLQGPQSYALIDHATGARRFATRPDIVVSKDGKPLLIIDTKWKRLKGEIDDAKRGVGQADIYQMMAYAHVYNSNSLMLLYPHHDELSIGEGLQTLHRIADKQDSRLAIATIALSDPKSVGMRLRRLLLGDAEVFNLTM